MPLCPLCSNDLIVRDTKRRHVITDDGSRKTYQLRRLRCKGCGKLHTELPAIVEPYKHYSSAVIEAELDRTRDDCPADTSTMNRWQKSFILMKPQIEGVLRSLWSEHHKKHYPLLKIDSLLQNLRHYGPGWLAVVNEMLIKSGIKIHTQFAFCP